MNGSTGEMLKLGPVCDLAAAQELLASMRERMQSAPGGTRIDASEVETLALPCIQVILAAAKSGHKIAVLNPSEAFASAFSDLALDWPRDEVAAEVASAAPPVETPAPPAPAPVFSPELEPITVPPEGPAPQREDTAMAKRILTIDDSKTIRDMLRMTLAGAGFEVLQAVDGQEGVEVMDREQVDLVITDINMPRMNGYEVVRHLRGNPNHQKLPILVLTTERWDPLESTCRHASLSIL